MKQVAQILKKNPNIKKVNLHTCRVGDDGVQELSAALGASCNLTHLNLHYSRVVNINETNFDIYLFILFVYYLFVFYIHNSI